MLHTFALEPGNLEDIDDIPSTNGSMPPSHGLDLVKVTQAYNALLQVGQPLLHANTIVMHCLSFP